MNRLSRIGIAAAVAALAAALSGSALAALTPTFAVSGSRLGADEAFGPTISLALRPSDDALGRLIVYVPTGWTLSSPASPSSAIGNVTATVMVGNAPVAARGTIVGDLKATLATGDPCDAGAHQAAWSMNLTAGGQALQIPMYVDAAAGGEAAYASYRIVACPPTTAAKLVSARFNLSALTGGTAFGEQVWRSLWTPQAAGAASVEAQSILRSPTLVTLGATRTKAGFKLSGTLTEDKLAVAGMRVSIGAGTLPTRLRTIATVKTSGAGTFSLRQKPGATRWLVATASIPQRSLDASACKPTFGVPCVSATIGSSRVQSKGIKVGR